jgi:quercetin dioxygenase-like cupin family protein
MKIRRFVTAEQADGGVLVQVEEAIPDTDTAAPATVLWGWDQLPALPIRPDDLGAEHVERELFPSSGGASVNLVVFPPGGGGAMHRTDSIDFAFVLEGEVVLRHPGNDDITLRCGDFFVQNGALHEWLNSSAERCVMACVVLAAKRAEE